LWHDRTHITDDEHTDEIGRKHNLFRDTLGPVSTHCRECRRSSELLALAGEQGSPAPCAIGRTLLDHAYSTATSPPRVACFQQPQGRTREAIGVLLTDG
jgi:hypothetical protein